LSTITIYNEGLNNTNWLVTAPSATSTANVIHCGPGWANNGGTGGSVCEATYPNPNPNALLLTPPYTIPAADTVTILITAPAQAGVNFGGWSYNCIQQGPVSATGPNSCTVTISPAVYDSKTLELITPANTNVTVGSIFN
jgi:hypothetical protein